MTGFDSIKHLFAHILYPNSYNNDAFVKYLRKRGASIGNNTRFIAPRRCHIDINRAMYISIGDNCCLSEVSILAHDYSWYVALESNNELIPDPGGEVIIGNNCFIGYQALILKNTEIGNNVIIGARSVVTGGKIPSNTVWAGSPAKMICTLDEYIEKKKKKTLESIKLRKRIIESKGRNNMNEYGYFMFYFLPRTIENYESYISKLEYNGVKNCAIVKDYFFNTKPLWDDYDSFISDLNKTKND